MSAARLKVEKTDFPEDIKKNMQDYIHQNLKDYETRRQENVQNQIMLKRDIFSGAFTIDEFVSLL